MGLLYEESMESGWHDELQGVQKLMDEISTERCDTSTDSDITIEGDCKVEFRVNRQNGEAEWRLTPSSGWRRLNCVTALSVLELAPIFKSADWQHSDFVNEVVKRWTTFIIEYSIDFTGPNACATEYTGGEGIEIEGDRPVPMWRDLISSATPLFAEVEVGGVTFQLVDPRGDGETASEDIIYVAPHSSRGKLPADYTVTWHLEKIADILDVDVGGCFRETAFELGVLSKLTQLGLGDIDEVDLRFGLDSRCASFGEVLRHMRLEDVGTLNSFNQREDESRLTLDGPGALINAYVPKPTVPSGKGRKRYAFVGKWFQIGQQLVAEIRPHVKTLEEAHKVGRLLERSGKSAHILTALKMYMGFNTLAAASILLHAGNVIGGETAVQPCYVPEAEGYTQSARKRSDHVYPWMLEAIGWVDLGSGKLENVRGNRPNVTLSIVEGKSHATWTARTGENSYFKRAIAFAKSELRKSRRLPAKVHVLSGASERMNTGSEVHEPTRGTGTWNRAGNEPEASGTSERLQNVTQTNCEENYIWGVNNQKDEDSLDNVYSEGINVEGKTERKEGKSILSLEVMSLASADSEKGTEQEGESPRQTDSVSESCKLKVEAGAILFDSRNHNNPIMPCGVDAKVEDSSACQSPGIGDIKHEGFSGSLVEEGTTRKLIIGKKRSTARRLVGMIPGELPTLGHSGMQRKVSGDLG